MSDKSEMCKQQSTHRVTPGNNTWQREQIRFSYVEEIAPLTLEDFTRILLFKGKKKK